MINSQFTAVGKKYKFVSTFFGSETIGNYGLSVVGKDFNRSPVHKYFKTYLIINREQGNIRIPEPIKYPVLRYILFPFPEFFSHFEP